VGYKKIYRLFVFAALVFLALLLHIDSRPLPLGLLLEVHDDIGFDCSEFATRISIDYSVKKKFVLPSPGFRSRPLRTLAPFSWCNNAWKSLKKTDSE
jgi:hypothetical protein